MWRQAATQQPHCLQHSCPCLVVSRLAAQSPQQNTARPQPHLTALRRQPERSVSLPAPWKLSSCTAGCRRRGICRASEGESDSSPSTSEEKKETQSRISQTLSGLDALLGIQEETTKGKEGDEKKSKDQENTNIDVNPEIYKALAEAEAARNNNGKAGNDDQVADSERDLQAVLDAAKKIGQRAQNPKMDNKEMETLIRDEINVFLDKVNSGMKQDMKKVREQVFGANVFWVTEMSPTAERPSEIVPGSWLVRGNLRTTKDEAFEKVVAGIKNLYGDKYTVFVIPDPEAEMQEPPRNANANVKAKERVAFVITPSQYVNQLQEGPGWQLVAAGLLFLLAFGAATRIGVIANTPKFLPQSIIDLLANPDSYNADTVPDELANFDFKPLLFSSVPISSSILVLQGLQEAAHRAIANARNVKLATPLFIPNDQIGLFGAVTQIKGLIRNRKDLFDIAVAGPLAGGLGSLALFATGLALSTGGARDDLLPVPAALLQGSLLLGGATQAVLGTGTAAGSSAAGAAAGTAATAVATIAVHPFVIGGWCGLVAVALNCLPVGSLDGGRMVQAAFGRQSLSISSFFVYVALGLGLLGSSLALPFGLYVLLFQRIPETGIQDTVTPPSGSRSTLALAMLAVSVLVLLPALAGGDVPSPSQITL